MTSQASTMYRPYLLIPAPYGYCKICGLPMQADDVIAPTHWDCEVKEFNEKMSEVVAEQVRKCFAGFTTTPNPAIE